MFITELTRGLRTLFPKIGNRWSFFSGREDISVESIEFGEPLDTPGGYGEGRWTPGSTAQRKVWAREADLGILGVQIEGETRQRMRLSRERVEKGESQGQKLEDNQSLRKSQKDIEEKWVGKRKEYRKLRGHRAREGRVFQEPVSDL